VTIQFSIDLPGILPVQEYPRLARAAESYGFDEVHVVDDLMFRPAWPLLALMGQQTERIKLGPALIAPRIVHPAYHAANLAVLDELTGGRATCALGRGAFFEMLGLGAPAKPLSMIRESVHLMRRLLAGDRTPLDGAVFSATSDLAFRFQPVRPEIPIVIGTFGPQTAKLAGEIADGLLTSCLANGDHYATLWNSMAAGASAAGRDPKSLQAIVSPICALSKDGAAARACVRPLLAEGLQWFQPMTAAAGIDDATIEAARKAAQAGDMRRAAELVPEKALDFFTVCGTPRDVIPRLEGLVAAGANHLAFTVMPMLDVDETIRLIAREVMPHFGR
jgi:5,10-methylenetetrahydromethanopterin reductase